MKYYVIIEREMIIGDVFADSEIDAIHAVDIGFDALNAAYEKNNTPTDISVYIANENILMAGPFGTYDPVSEALIKKVKNDSDHCCYIKRTNPWG